MGRVLRRHVGHHDRLRQGRDLILDVLAGDHRHDAGHGLRLARVDALDPGMGHLAAHEHEVQHARHHDVGDVASATGGQPLVLLAIELRAEPAVGGAGVHRVVHVLRSLECLFASLGTRQDAVAQLRRSLLRRFANRVDDVHVAGASAQVADQRVADLLVGRVRMLLDEFGHVHQDARRTVAALQGVMLVERLLQRAQLAVLGQPLDRGHGVAVGLHREHQAALHRLAVEVHRTGATHAFVGATDVGAGQAGALANEIREQHADRHGLFEDLAVDGDADGLGAHDTGLLELRWLRIGRTRGGTRWTPSCAPSVRIRCER